jgi:hypothetical protein
METKPSVYTSEFWLVILGQVFFTLNTSHIWTYMSPKWSGIIQGIILFGYLHSRGLAKSKGSFDPNLLANYKLFPRLKHANPRTGAHRP